jgi:DNA topoisomerase VI subunit A
VQRFRNTILRVSIGALVTPLLVAALAALLMAGGCAAADPPPANGHGLDQALREQDEARAEYDAYRRWYATQKLQQRMKTWDQMQERAQRQAAEQEKERQVREEYIRRRWQAY